MLYLLCALIGFGIGYYKALSDVVSGRRPGRGGRGRPTPERETMELSTYRRN